MEATMTLFVDKSRCHFTKTSRTHACTSASDIGIRPGAVPEALTITERDKRWIFHFVATKRDNEGDVEFFTYKWVSPRGERFELTVFND